MTGRLLAVAHRAGNSLSGLQRARELGVDVVEADVHLRRGRLEIRHLKTLGPLPWLWDRWESQVGRGALSGSRTGCKSMTCGKTQEVAPG